VSDLNDMPVLAGPMENLIRSLKAELDEARQVLTEREASYQAEVASLTADRDRLRADIEQSIRDTDGIVRRNMELIVERDNANIAALSREHDLRQAESERDTLAARLAQAERVVAAARAWVNYKLTRANWRARVAQVEELGDVVDALDAAATPGEEGGT
jgi:hypothetical protein